MGTGMDMGGDRGDHVGGAFFLTMVGLGWVMIGLSALGPIPLGALLPPLGAFTLLLAGAGALRRAARGLTAPPPAPEVDRVIARATAVEAAAIVVIFLAGGLLHRPAWIMPLVALAVGLHFFPLARVLRRPLYFATGGALCAVAVAVPLLVPQALGAHHVPGWRLAVGLGGGAVIWLTALALLVLARARLRASGAGPP